MAQAPQGVMSSRPQLMLSQPGVARDGTRLSQQSYLMAYWCRWYQGKPRKMRGYVEQLRSVNGIVRAIDVFSNDGFSFVHIASGRAIQRFAINNAGGGNTGLIDRTPVGYLPNDSFNWQLAEQVDIPTNTTMIYANGTPSASSITTSSAHPVYYGDIIASTPLIQIPDGTAFTGSISGTTLTVTAMPSGFLEEGVEIFGSGIPAGTEIVSVTTEFSPGPPVVNGVYELNNSMIASSMAMTAHQVRSSGGICAVGLTLFLYGHDGIIQWSTSTSSIDFIGEGSGDSRPVGDKIVRALPIRGQSGPAIILWSLSSVIIGSFVGPPLDWDFTTVTTTGSILSSNGVIEHEGIYYWPTTSGWALFNGVVRELPNNDNKQWFLDNLNWDERQKVFAYKVTRWSEIWWCFPRGNATECNWAVIYNWIEKRWYDTPLPNGGRSAGFYEFVYNYPIMAGIEPHEDTAGGYSMWQHEYGLDEMSGVVAIARAIRAGFQTHEFNVVVAPPGQPGADQGLSYSILEPDFDQKGPLDFTVISRANARARERVTGPISIVETPETPDQQLTKFKHSGRLTSFRIESNWLGGDFIAGSPVVHWQPGDARRED